MRHLYVVFAALLLFCSCGEAQAWLGPNCTIYWKAYTLAGDEASSQPETASPPSTSAVKAPADDSSPIAPGKQSAMRIPTSRPIPSAKKSSSPDRILIALTISPRSGEYLYGPDSSEGLPTSMEVSYAPLDAFPMSTLSSGEIAALTDDKGFPLAVRAPAASMKKETPFAEVIFPGGSDTNPPIYPGPVTFWAEVPMPESALGGIAIRAGMSGLLCSASSCTPAAGSLELALSEHEMRQFPAASDQAWFSDWQRGESVLVPPPTHDQIDFTLKQHEPSFSGGRSIPVKTTPAPSSPVESNYLAVFASLEPIFSNPELEVQFLGEALFFGLLAGLLLNLMPCVLPVVSLKFSALLAVSSMTDKARQAKAFRSHCLIFALGILCWFAILSILLGTLGWAWGELFQQPVVLVILGMILFLLGLSLFGVFSLPILDLKVANDKHPHWQAFVGGMLATLLATPCSGPLLGGVLAWAIRQPLPVLLLTVISVGIGMALPYGILAMCPKLVHLLPRPGSWTLRLEQLLGFFLMASVLYLASLLPPEWVPAFLFNLLAITFAAWLWGQIGHLRASRLRRNLARILSVLVVLFSAGWGVSSLYADTNWEQFDPQTFTELLGNEPLLLEFTADWCPSCKALEHTTLNEKRMADLRRRYKVRTIRVDLTREEESAKELLRALDSTSIPVLALFPEGENSRQPMVLRDLVTPAQLEEAAARVY